MMVDGMEADAVAVKLPAPRRPVEEPHPWVLLARIALLTDVGREREDENAKLKDRVRELEDEKAKLANRGRELEDERTKLSHSLTVVSTELLCVPESFAADFESYREAP